MHNIKNYRQKYDIVFPQELIPGDYIVIPYENECRFIRYDQGRGTGSIEYGEYGILHYNDENEDCREMMIYEHYPILRRA